MNGGSLAERVGAISVVLLDLDDTLVVDDAAIVSALFATCFEADTGVDPEALFRAVWHTAWSWLPEGPTAPAHRLGIGALECLISDFEGGHPMLDDLRRQAAAYRHAIWSDALAALGRKDDGLARTLADGLRRRRRSAYVLREGARELLDEARTHFTVALVSNGAPDIQREKLACTGIASCFDAVAISGVEGIAKPDPRLFRLALDRLGQRAEDAVMIGDAPEDAAGAQAAGIDALLIRREDQEQEGPPRPTLPDVAALLRERVR